MEDLNENIKTLQEKIDNNATRIIENMNKLHSHEEMINDNSSKIQQNSYALSILKDYKTGIKGWRIVALVFVVLWILTVGYLVYVLNDVGTIETDTQEVQQESTSGNNNYIGNDGDIINGKADN